MPRVEFLRNDLRVSARALSNGKWELTYEHEGDELAGTPAAPATQRKQVVSQDELVAGTQRSPPAAVVAAWKRGTAPSGPFRRLDRVVVSADDQQLAAIPCESILGRVGQVVRLSSVRANTGFEPFKLPLRIVQAGTIPGLDLPGLVNPLFGGAPVARVRQALRIQTVASLQQLESRAALEGPSADVLHIASYTTDSDPTILSSADPEVVGTQAWLARYCFRRQTRLLILSCAAARAADHRQLASRLIAVGGPAVLIESLPDGETHRRFLQDFYSDLIHDFPLDAILQNLGHLWSEGGAPSLFVGADREEDLRVSSVGLRAMAIRPSAAVVRSLPGLRGAMDDFRNSWTHFEFEFHERLGLLPLTKNVDRMRSILRSARRDRGAAGVGAIGSPARARPPAARKSPVARKALGKIKGPAARPARKRPYLPVKSAPPPARFVNIAFFRDGGPGQGLEPVPQKGARLVVGDLVHLGVEVGPRNVRIRVSDLAPIDEERFRWKPQMKGVWLEVGVTAIDFDIIGSPVREVWLPREGPSERVFFPVIPRGPDGVARLRVCLYHHDDIVQSFKVVAAVVRAGKRLADAQVGREVADRLGLPSDQVAGLGFMTRLEYSTANVAQLATHPRPPGEPGQVRLSIVANDSEGDTVITVKGRGIYSTSVLTDATLPDRVQRIRDLLRRVSVMKFADNTTGYAFGQPGEPNAGTRAQLEGALTAMAILGWRMFDKLLLQGAQTQLAAQLEAADEAVIHVAHILRDKVIPWGLLYDRPYNKNQTTDAEGRPVAFAVCPGGMPDASGNLPVKPCFGEGCLLQGHPGKRVQDAQGKTLLPETVVCPRHFWGFRHVIEVPPQQVPPQKSGIPLCTEIPVTGKAALAAGVNCTLSLYDAHMKELAAAKTKIPALWSDPPEYNRQRIIEMLKNLELCGIYFYCHATTAGEEGEPELVFQGPNEGDPRGVITPDGFNHTARWSRRPLVFLNGCQTAGYNPEAMSPFFKKLVDDRGASGVVGTEIIVNEQLAREMARRFFQSFLDREPAGKALLTARRALLAKNNPLGLVYTLYASADLKLTTNEGRG